MNRAELVAIMQATATEKPRKITVKGWCDLYIRNLTVAEVDEQSQEKAVVVDENVDPKTLSPIDVMRRNKGYRLARSAARLICDENGNKLFDRDNPDDVALLAAQPWKYLHQVLDASDDYKDDDEKK